MEQLRVALFLVYGELSAVSINVLLFAASVLSMQTFRFSGFVPLLAALLIHVGALLDHYEHCKQGRTHVLHECTFIAISAWTIRVQRLLLLRAPSHAASLSGEVHEVQSDLLQLDL